MKAFSKARILAAEEVLKLSGKEFLPFGVLILNIRISFLCVLRALCGE